MKGYIHVGAQLDARGADTPPQGKKYPKANPTLTHSFHWEWAIGSGFGAAALSAMALDNVVMRNARPPTFGEPGAL